MLRQAIAAFALVALASGGPATAAGQKPPRQSEPDDGDSNDRGRRGPVAPQPVYAPPAYAPVASPAARYTVLTEKQKRCGVQRGCELDSRNPCPPCW